MVYSTKIVAEFNMENTPTKSKLSLDEFGDHDPDVSQATISKFGRARENSIAEVNEEIESLSSRKNSVDSDGSEEEKMDS